MKSLIILLVLLSLIGCQSKENSMLDDVTKFQQLIAESLDDKIEEIEKKREELNTKYPPSPEFSIDSMRKIINPKPQIGNYLNNPSYREPGVIGERYYSNWINYSKQPQKKDAEGSITISIADKGVVPAWIRVLEWNFMLTNKYDQLPEAGVFVYKRGRTDERATISSPIDHKNYKWVNVKFMDNGDKELYSLINNQVLIKVLIRNSPDSDVFPIVDQVINFDWLAKLNH